MPPFPTPLPSSRAEWLAARASLAGRRSGRFVVGAAVTFLVVLLALLITPQLGVRARRAVPAPVVRVDTVPLARYADSVRQASIRADSLYERALRASEYLAAGTGSGVSGPWRVRRDSLQALATSLDTLLARASNTPLPVSFRALATSRALRLSMDMEVIARAAALADSLDALERQRVALEPVGGGAARPVAELTAKVRDVGLAITEMALRRRAELARAIAEVEATVEAPVLVDTAGPNAKRMAARAATGVADTALIVAHLQNAAADSIDGTVRARANRRVPPVAMLAAALLLGVIAGFSASLFSEIGHPTIATAREAERASATPVLAVAHVRDQMPRIGGIDPFRMLYLGLTATGTRARTVAITGDDRAVVATVAGRLALAAAADERATLVIDADAEGSPVAGYYNERPEPGFTDAVAGVRLWREVARPVGASNGLAIDIVPGGSIRSDQPDAAAPDEFARFRSEYDFGIVVAPTAVAMQAFGVLVARPTTIVCVELGRTTIEWLRATTADLRTAGVELHGIVLWDAELPQLPPRSELLAKALAMRARILTGGR